VRWYLSILSTSASRVASAVGLLADPHQLPAVVHCAAGKDRTGVLVGLVLSSIGVPDEVVADDYARSEDALTAILERLAGMPSYAADASGLHPDRNRTHPDTMIGFLAGVRARYGSVSGYLAGIGVGPAAQQQLAASLLEG
jgi:protein-tyrosine phosphatase